MEKEIPRERFQQILNDYAGCTVSVFTTVILNATDGSECIACEIVHAGSDYLHVIEYGKGEKEGLNDNSFIPYHAISRVTIELEDGRKPPK